MRWVVLPFRFVVVCLGLASCVATRQAPVHPVVAADEMPPEDRLGVEDVFEVRVVGESQLSGLFQISADGTVDYPFIGRLRAVGLRVGEIQGQITDKLKDGYLRSPQVTVMVKEWNSRKVSVLGQVQKPGPITYFPKMTIVDAVAAAGGFTGIAAKNSVTLRRERREGGWDLRSYPVADIAEGRAANVIVRPGDVVVVEERLF